MKPIKAKEEIMKQIEELENKKVYQTMNVNMKSKIVGYSNDIDPAYFLRADYFKDEHLGRQPQEYWQIPNPNTPYFVDRRTKMHNYKELMKVEKEMGITSSNEFYLKQIKDRYDFLIQPRKISMPEYEERMANERIQLIIRE